MGGKILVYGFGRVLTRVLCNFVEKGINLDVIDSDMSKWGGHVLCGSGEKIILPPKDINVDEYNFCIIGSDTFSAEIESICLEMGFHPSQIIPSVFIEYQFFGVRNVVKKDELLNRWKEFVEKDGLTEVVKNWHLNEDKTECLIKVKNCVGVKVKLSCCNLYEKDGLLTIDNIINSAESSSSVCGTGSVEWIVHSDNMNLYRLSLKRHWGFFSWISITYEETEWHKLMNKERLHKAFLQNLNWVSNFYYHDEDYLAMYGSLVGGTILDLGSNYGQSMVAFYRMTNSNIYSVEASPNHAAMLNCMKKLLGDGNRIEVINVGISDQKAILKWYQPQIDLCSGSFDEGFIESRNLGCGISVIELQCEKLDDLFLNLDDIWFIKMDIEGFEEKGIKGGLELINELHPIILLENNNHKNSIVSMLDDCYEVRYFDYINNIFNKVPINDMGLNYWLIPKDEYRSNRVEKFLGNRI